MQVVEPCILTRELIDYVKRLGYDNAWLEIKGDFPKEEAKKYNDVYFRITLIPRTVKEFNILIKRNNYEGFTIFIKPISFDIFKLSLKNKRVSVLSFDKTNSSLLLKKSVYSLLKQNPKPIEISLKYWSHLLITRAAEIGYKLGIPILFSSCASTFNELWSIESKISFLEINGIYPEYAILWIFKSPILVLNR